MCNALDGVSDVIDNELYSTSLQKVAQSFLYNVNIQISSHDLCMGYLVGGLEKDS